MELIRSPAMFLYAVKLSGLGGWVPLDMRVSWFWIAGISRGASSSDPLFVPATPSSRALLSESEVYADADALPAFSRLHASARAATVRNRTRAMCTPQTQGQW